jgi:hypothetical protein
MLSLTVTITGESTEDLVIALGQVQGSVEEGYTSGHGESTDSSFKFDLTEDKQ